ncbi:ATP-binding protein [Pseudoalteromonas phenolica O-BC30]|nr:ATP-binding protein [Pseudoalteromonas phenolica O-BC30]
MKVHELRELGRKEKKIEVKIMTVKYQNLKTRSLKGNPLAEAIHPRLNESEFEDMVTDEITVPDDIEEYSNYEKELEALSLMKTVSPTSMYYETYCDLYNVLMAGFMSRNPLSDEQKRYNNLISTRQIESEKTSSECMIVTGLSGTGKSTLMNTVLDIFEQTHSHTKDGKYGVSFQQIVYIKCDIPANASADGVCSRIIREIDKLTNDGRSKDFKLTKGKKIEDTIDNIVAACSTLGLGMLIFDEVQNIAFASAGDKTKIFRLMNDMTNIAKIPVINIGTTKAIKTFETEFSNIRRLGLPVDLVNFKADEEDWQLLVEYAWSYQLVSAPLELTNEIRKVIYDFTQGVPYCLFYLISQANISAIRNEKKINNGWRFSTCLQHKV